MVTILGPLSIALRFRPAYRFRPDSVIVKAPGEERRGESKGREERRGESRGGEERSGESREGVERGGQGLKGESRRVEERSG